MTGTRSVDPVLLPHTHIEAIWNSGGAACLTEARRESEEPDIRAQIEAECAAVRHALPTCGASPLLWAARAMA